MKKILEMNIPFNCIIHVAGQASKEGSFQDVLYDLHSNAKSTLVLLLFYAGETSDIYTIQLIKVLKNIY